MEVSIRVKTENYFNACTVKGYIHDHYPYVTNLSVTIYPDNKCYIIQIAGETTIDRTLDFQDSVYHLRQHNIILPSEFT